MATTLIVSSRIAFAIALAGPSFGQFPGVPNQLSSLVSSYRVDAGTGARTAALRSLSAKQSGPASIIVDPAGQFVGNGAFRTITESPSSKHRHFMAMDTTREFASFPSINTDAVSSDTIAPPAGGLLAIVGPSFPAGSSPVPSVVASGQHRCLNKHSGIMDWWPADGNAEDAFGDNNGILSPSASFAQGVLGQAFSLARSEASNVRVPDAPTLRVSAGDFTVTAWVKLTQPCSGAWPHSYCLEPIVSKIVNSNDGFSDGWSLLYDEGVFFFCFGGGYQSGCPPQTFLPTTVAVKSSTTPAASTWYHLAGVKERGRISLYVNGKLDSPVQQLENFYDSNAGDIYLGGFGPGGRLTGQIDEVAIFSGALNPGQIRKIFKSGISGYCGIDTIADSR